MSKNFKIFIAACSCVLVLCVISGFAQANIFSSAINTVTFSLQQSASALFGKADRKPYSQLEDEVKKLEEENAQLRSSLVQYYDAMRENERLWKYYDLKKENPGFELLPASVIRRDPNDDFYSFTIDCGIRDGVSVNDPVVTDRGLVGYVVSAEYATSKICTVLSAQIKVGALDSRTADSGILTGNALYCDDNLTTLTAISADQTIKKGDILVTSGLSGVYPENLILGEIVEIMPDDYDTTTTAVVRPFEDVRIVSDVAVITSFEGKGGGSVPKDGG